VVASVMVGGSSWVVIFCVVLLFVGGRRRRTRGGHGQSGTGGGGRTPLCTSTACAASFVPRASAPRGAVRPVLCVVCCAGGERAASPFSWLLCFREPSAVASSREKRFANL
jgi:hypothetical protein